MGYPDILYNYTGIPFEIANEEVRASNITYFNNEFIFSLHTANCWTTCQIAKGWSVSISEDCDFISIEALGVENFNRDRISIHPNPVSKTLYLKNLNSESYTVKIYSVQGQLLRFINFSSEELNVTNLKTGIYFIEITSSKGSKQVERFIKL